MFIILASALRYVCIAGNGVTSSTLSSSALTVSNVLVGTWPTGYEIAGLALATVDSINMVRMKVMANPSTITNDQIGITFLLLKSIDLYDYKWTTT